MNTSWDETFEGLLREALRFLPDDASLQPDMSTSDAGLDSLGIVHLLMVVEEQYDISIPDELLRWETFATPGALWAAISGLREAEGSTDEPLVRALGSGTSQPDDAQQAADISD